MILTKWLLSPHSGVCLPVGALSCQPREQWYNDRELLIHSGESGVNNRALSILQSSAFGICLDSEVVPKCPDDMDRRLWHNYGQNRWFDKPVQFIYFRDGRGGAFPRNSSEATKLIPLGK
tara:strand:- start:3276 stop:3635 length:360 start_codon:yes stop_codon:yes gene_type:complete